MQTFVYLYICFQINNFEMLRLGTIYICLTHTSHRVLLRKYSLVKEYMLYKY